MPKSVGILALQGGYASHGQALRDCGFNASEVRTVDQLNATDGLILPGGESTTQIKLLKRFGLWTALDDYARQGRPILATCAGMILAAQRVHSPEQDSFGWLDIDVTRNGWGRQVHSGEALADPPSTHESFGDEPVPLLFIRAPRITRVGPNVTVLATLNDEPIMVRSGNVYAASFHPELTPDRRIHRAVFE